MPFAQPVKELSIHQKVESGRFELPSGLLDFRLPITRALPDPSEEISFSGPPYEVPIRALLPWAVWLPFDQDKCVRTGTIRQPLRWQRSALPVELLTRTAAVAVDFHQLLYLSQCTSFYPESIVMTNSLVACYDPRHKCEISDSNRLRSVWKTNMHPVTSISRKLLAKSARKESNLHYKFIRLALRTTLIRTVKNPR